MLTNACVATPTQNFVREIFETVNFFLGKTQNFNTTCSRIFILTVFSITIPVIQSHELLQLITLVVQLQAAMVASLFL